jgi:hypothetical protein
MNHVHVSARCPTTLVAEISLMARRAGRSFSAEVRAALAEHVERVVHQTDDDPARHGEVVGSSPVQVASDGTA